MLAKIKELENENVHFDNEQLTWFVRDIYFLLRYLFTFPFYSFLLVHIL